MKKFWLRSPIPSDVLKAMKKTLKRKKKYEYMLIGFEPNPGSGEDSATFCFKKDYGMIAVFDGCGGLGSRRYETCDSHTGAYLASRLGAWVIDEWCKKNDPRQYMSKHNCERLLKDIKTCLSDQFKREKEYLTDKSMPKLRGSMIKTLPTTMSLAFIEHGKHDELQCMFIWAGDSRGYILSPQKGLQQITTDDLVMPLDAMENLLRDAPLSNMINADTPFALKGRFLCVGHPCIIFTATDGMFNYFQSPMDFEFALLDSMQNAPNLQSWNHMLTKLIGDIAEDDSTAVVYVAGYHSFGQLKRRYFQRWQQMKQEFMISTEGEQSEQIMELWKKYKGNYEEAGGNCREYTSGL